MGQNFIGATANGRLLPASPRDWLAENHLAWFVLDAVAEIDLGAFFAAHRADGWGRPAHDPAMMA